MKDLHVKLLDEAPVSGTFYAYIHGNDGSWWAYGKEGWFRLPGHPLQTK